MTWTQQSLEEFLLLQRGHDLPESRRRDGPVPVISSSGITGWHDEARAKGPGVVTGRYGTIGEVFYVEGDYWPLNTALYVVDFKGNDPRFAAYLLEFVLESYQSDKAAVPGVDRNVLHKLRISAPSVSVQRKVADVLSSYDDLIENNRRRLALLEDAARQLYREWFVRLRFPGREHTRIVDGVPEGWERRSLAAVCVDEGIQSGPFGSQLHQSDYTETGVPVVMPKDLVKFRISLDSIARIPEDLANRLGRHRMVYGDIVYGRRGDIGRRSFIGPKQQGFFCGTGSLRIRPNPSIVNPRYLFDALGAPETAGIIANRAKGATMLNLNAKILKTVPVLIPTRLLQERYAEYVLPIDTMVDLLSEQNQKLRAARDLLLPRLMSGELTV